ncbi:type V secretory pathway adhesin AidA [Kribbella aluminosa]|uniref:Type V secretory pathway adhesin AidA n=1 Tax=Kribbella aluminosa TaxID=416017 RepID=A0ABS4UYC7_9ACTN|nr:hypothetical protein [Kribbella aluminosa]MBP2356546.1 type V secretory pathway adhesin AidA [Kribbella aluminosa]
MPRRPLLTAVATLSTLTLLTACNGSPEAGRPNTTPTSTTATPAPTPTPTAPITPTRPAAEQAAIAAAKARYLTAHLAIDVALNNPPVATRENLLRAGTGGNWLIQVLGSVQFNLDRGWYQAGRTGLEAVTVASVKLNAEQPEVRFNACLDSSKTSLRYQATRKPVPAIPANGTRHKVQAQMVYAPLIGQSTKMWFLINETDTGSC